MVKRDATSVEGFFLNIHPLILSTNEPMVKPPRRTNRRTLANFPQPPRKSSSTYHWYTQSDQCSFNQNNNSTSARYQDDSQTSPFGLSLQTHSILTSVYFWVSYNFYLVLHAWLLGDPAATVLVVCRSELRTCGSCGNDSPTEGKSILVGYKITWHGCRILQWPLPPRIYWWTVTVLCFTVFVCNSILLLSSTVQADSFSYESHKNMMC